MTSPRKLAALIGSSVLLAAVAWSFYLVGSPAYNRQVNGDKERRANLAALARRIENWYSSNKELPKSLEVLPTNNYRWDRAQLTDPLSGKQYGYEVIDKHRYKLCAEFSIATTDLPDQHQGSSRHYYYYEHENTDFREHPAGEHCFELEIPARLRKRA